MLSLYNTVLLYLTIQEVNQAGLILQAVTGIPFDVLCHLQVIGVLKQCPRLLWPLQHYADLYKWCKAGQDCDDYDYRHFLSC